MSGIKSLVLLAFVGSLGFIFLLLGCGLPQYNNWWPMFVIVFYVLYPIPILFVRRNSDRLSGGRGFCLFLTAGIVVSAMALPIVLARAEVSKTQPSKGVISGGAAALVEIGNIIIFATITRFMWPDESNYMGW